ncbi:Uncharacterised protein [Clostridium sporogenes]|nr:Uncharacterised protein [Clostridium sporogenes]
MRERDIDDRHVELRDDETDADGGDDARERGRESGGRYGRIHASIVGGDGQAMFQRDAKRRYGCRRECVPLATCVDAYSARPMRSMPFAAPASRRHAEALRERMRERALVREADAARDVDERMPAVGEQHDRGVEPQPLQVAMGRFAECIDEQLMKAPHPVAAVRGEIGDAQRFGEPRAQPAVDAREIEARRRRGDARIVEQRVAQASRGLPLKAVRGGLPCVAVRRIVLRGGRRDLRDERRERRVDRHGPRMVEQPLRYRERRGGQVDHELAIVAEARVVVARAGRNQPGRVPVDALADSVHRHHHRAIDAEHDLVEVVHVRRFARGVAAQRDGGGGDAFHREGNGGVQGQTSSSSTSNTSVAFGGITPPAPRGP